MDKILNDGRTTEIIAKYPLASMLHTADYLSTFYMPNVNGVIYEEEKEEDTDESSEETTQNPELPF